MVNGIPHTMRLVLIITISLAVFACSPAAEETEPAETAADNAPIVERVALPEMAIPADNPMTREKVELGKQLFFDKRLSRNGDMACETCHLPEMGWTDGKELSPKFDGNLNTRHTPTLINVGYYREWYWDGRMPTLEAQIEAAWTGQMGAVPDQVSETLNGIEGYRTQFEQHMGGPATGQRIVQALATFVRTLVSDDAPWDRYEKRIDTNAVSADAIAGFEVFSGKANCTLCHLPPLYTDALYHNVGVGFDKPNPDMGRGAFLQRTAPERPVEAQEFMGAFKTPTMRSVTETGPYFHDGRAATLEEAVDFMLAGGVKNEHLDAKLEPKPLTAEERNQLLAFLRALTPEPKPFVRPTLP